MTRVASLVIGVWLGLCVAEGVAAPAVRAEPVQRELRDVRPIALKGFQLWPQASFRLEGRVLSRKRYWFGFMSDLSPVDLAMGWGEMSDSAVLDKIKVRQGGRWYFWKSRDLPISRTAVSRQSANMHMIPANHVVEKLIKKVKKGQIIRLSGRLVNVKQQGKVVWHTSLSRKDAGNRSCEIVLVDSVQVVKK